MIGIDMKYEREWLVNTLLENESKVTFTKKDGTSRVMYCTLHPSFLPPAKKDDALSQKKIRALNEEVVVVYDTESEGWRSFRVDSVLDFESL
jgi:hypothetical protein